MKIHGINSIIFTLICWIVGICVAFVGIAYIPGDFGIIAFALAFLLICYPSWCKQAMKEQKRREIENENEQMVINQMKSQMDNKKN